MEARASPLGRTGVSFSKFCLSAMMFGAWATRITWTRSASPTPASTAGPTACAQRNGDLVIVFGPTAPAEDADNSIQTVPAKGWFRPAHLRTTRDLVRQDPSPEKSNPSADESVICSIGDLLQVAGEAERRLVGRRDRARPQSSPHRRRKVSSTLERRATGLHHPLWMTSVSPGQRASSHSRPVWGARRCRLPRKVTLPVRWFGSPTLSLAAHRDSRLSVAIACCSPLLSPPLSATVGTRLAGSATCRRRRGAATERRRARELIFHSPVGPGRQRIRLGGAEPFAQRPDRTSGRLRRGRGRAAALHRGRRRSAGRPAARLPGVLVRLAAADRAACGSGLPRRRARPAGVQPVVKPDGLAPTAPTSWPPTSAASSGSAAPSPRSWSATIGVEPPPGRSR